MFIQIHEVLNETFLFIFKNTSTYRVRTSRKYDGERSLDHHCATMKSSLTRKWFVFGQIRSKSNQSRSYRFKIFDKRKREM